MWKRGENDLKLRLPRSISPRFHLDSTSISPRPKNQLTSIHLDITSIFAHPFLTTLARESSRTKFLVLGGWPFGTEDAHNLQNYVSKTCQIAEGLGCNYVFYTGFPCSTLPSREIRRSQVETNLGVCLQGHSWFSSEKYMLWEYGFKSLLGHANIRLPLVAKNPLSISCGHAHEKPPTNPHQWTLEAFVLDLCAPRNHRREFLGPTASVTRAAILRRLASWQVASLLRAKLPWIGGVKQKCGLTRAVCPRRWDKTNLVFYGNGLFGATFSWGWIFTNESVKTNWIFFCTFCPAVELLRWASRGSVTVANITSIV